MQHCDRGTKDESFVRRALAEATSEDGRWIAKHFFNNQGLLEPKVLAALITETAIYVERGREEAINLESTVDARRFIDKYHSASFQGSKS